MVLPSSARMCGFRLMRSKSKVKKNIRITDNHPIEGSTLEGHISFAACKGIVHFHGV